MALDPDRYRLSEAEHQAIFDKRIKPHLFAGAKSQEQPVGVVFGGQPGAGKSAAVDDALQGLKSRGGAAQIIGDDMRGYHPRYASLMAQDDKTAAFYTDRDTGRWVEKSIQFAKEQRFNVVIEGTMRDGNKVAETMQSLRSAGYEVDARALAVNARLSWQGVLQRYENQKADRGYARMTAPHSHEEAYNAVPKTIERIENEKLADRVTIYRRGGEILYTNELRDGDWKDQPRGRAVVDEERARSLTLQERREFAAAYDKLADMLARPERQATPAERGTVDELRSRARRDLVAETFRVAEPAEAVKQHPELASAVGRLHAIERKAEADGLEPAQRTAVMAQARQRLAESIERGEPAAPLELRTQVARDRGRDVDR